MFEEGEERFQCRTCGKTYKRRPVVIRHLRYECGIEPKFACPFCPYKAKWNFTLKTHITLRHRSAAQQYVEITSDKND